MPDIANILLCLLSSLPSALSLSLSLSLISVSDLIVFQVNLYQMRWERPAARPLLIFATQNGAEVIAVQKIFFFSLSTVRIVSRHPIQNAELNKSETREEEDDKDKKCRSCCYSETVRLFFQVYIYISSCLPAWLFQFEWDPWWMESDVCLGRSDHQ